MPESMTGFLPTLSDSQPQKKFVANCAAANEKAISPTYKPTCPTFTSGKVEAICGRYGLRELNAVCSARAMTPRMTSCRFGRGVEVVSCRAGDAESSLPLLR